MNMSHISSLPQSQDNPAAQASYPMAADQKNVARESGLKDGESCGKIMDFWICPHVSSIFS